MIDLTKGLLQKLRECFPKSFINMQFELIVYPKTNSYFRLEDIESELVLKCEVIEWLSREACKSYDKASQKYHLNGINQFLGTNFTQDEMMEIYTYLGNQCNRRKTMEFIVNGYDLSVLKNKGD